MPVLEFPEKTIKENAIDAELLLEEISKSLTHKIDRLEYYDEPMPTEYLHELLTNINTVKDVLWHITPPCA